MRVGDMFKDADVIDLSEWQAARRNGRAALTMANRADGTGPLYPRKRTLWNSTHNLAEKGDGRQI